MGFLKKESVVMTARPRPWQRLERETDINHAYPDWGIVTGFSTLSMGTASYAVKIEKGFRDDTKIDTIIRFLKYISVPADIFSIFDCCE
jgi:hypothetical protein